MPNHLASENSAYLLQHMNNPVDWYPWGSEALERARKENKPIFLSIGYAACHWCHVMAHESFEDPQIASFLNEYFISIKVDREDRPDIDSIYMKAVVAMVGQGGWPLSVFLTPEGQPFYGGTYFPPEGRANLPSFASVLQGVARAWQDNRENAREVGASISDYLKRTSEIQVGKKQLNVNLLDVSQEAILSTYDWQKGGWGHAPKFPQPMVIEFLIRRAIRGDESAFGVVNHVLDAMSQGGMYDLIGGGFHRYSVDENWCIPHYEKMLYDNAQLAQVYLHAYSLTGDLHWKGICEDTLCFILERLTSLQGAFYSSLDADTTEGEGRYYLWTADEIKSVLVDEDDSALALSAYGIAQPDATVIRRKATNDDLSRKFDLSVEEVKIHLELINSRLRKARLLRPHPTTDDKVIVTWNALTMGVFAEASAYLHRPDFLEIAIRNARFILDHLLVQSQLFHSWRRGRAQNLAFLDDYAALIIALLKLFQVNPDLLWFSTAKKLAIAMLEHFSDDRGGFYDTDLDASSILVRPKEVQDNAVPSGNAMAAQALLYLAEFDEEPEWGRKAREMFSMVQDAITKYPTAFAYWLSALDFSSKPVKQIALVSTNGDDNLVFFKEKIWNSYRPGIVVAIGNGLQHTENPALLRDRRPINEKVTAYVCENFTCHKPTNSIDEFQLLLDPPSAKNRSKFG